VRELLRPPALAEQALAGRDLRPTPLSYVFERTTADDPFRRDPVPPPPPASGNRSEAEAALVRGAQDPETGIDRLLTPPAAREWRADGWATISPAAPDPALDRLAGARLGAASFSSSARYQGRPGFRASSAFDGDPATAWVAPWHGHETWIAWRTARPRTIRELRLEPATTALRLPSLVEVRSGAFTTGALAVARSGTVALPRPVRGREFRLVVLQAGGPGAPSAQARRVPAVAIGDLTGPGIPHIKVPRSGALRTRCGDLQGTVGPARFGLRPAGTIAAFDAGSPLRAAGCGRAPKVPAGPTDLHLPQGLFRPLILRLRSPAPDPVARAAVAGGGSVIDPGSYGRGSHEGVKLDVRGPSWLVLGESYSRGWRAECGGRSLGAPQVVDGFANGWRVGPGCRDASFTFSPQSVVTGGYVAGALACAALLALLLLRRPARRTTPAPEPLAADDRPWRLPARQALAAGAIAAAVFGFLFALRAGVVIGPAVAVLLWRGASARALTLAAGALLALGVPLLYLLFPGDDRGGYDTRYAVEHLAAHWVAVAAFVLLVLALARTLAAARRKAAA
jgi:hypothetical protein